MGAVFGDSERRRPRQGVDGAPQRGVFCRRTAYSFTLCVFFTYLCVSGAVYADYPVIQSLDAKAGDAAFKQYVDTVEIGRRLVYNRSRPVDPKTAASVLTIYQYTVLQSDEFIRLQARCGVGIEGIATLNRIAHPSLSAGASLLLPSVPGVFVPLDIEGGTANDLEKLMAGGRLGMQGVMERGAVITVNRNGKKERFLFLPGETFSQTERAFFLAIGKNGDSFRYPLSFYTMTSGFGIRRNPITGTVKNHDGLDLAAPLGAEVCATRAGVVSEIGNDPIYGNYVIIGHEDNWASLYGHLSKIEIALHTSVGAGDLIGRVGSTGQSTGPHLHFELRQNGRARDPGKYLFKGN